MIRHLFTGAALAGLAALAASGVSAQSSSARWSFAVSGDSRNCGDVVMPGIAESARKNHAEFYWHLGDLRATYTFDEDILHQPEHVSRPLTISEYLNGEWQDFIDNQIQPFASAGIPFMLGIGNHELVPPKTRAEFIAQFADWLDTPMLREQRLKDDPRDHMVRTYYRWIRDGIVFYNLDSASADMFDSAQMRWFERLLTKDMADPSIKTIVAGMHEALPDSISSGHSMNESPTETETGRRVYADLLKAQNEGHKHVYVLASHMHIYMSGIFNTDYARQHGGILPGWIAGTAGAVRYKLPEHSSDALEARTNVYGSLLGTVHVDGQIGFIYQPLEESDLPAAVVSRYGQQFVNWCFAENTQAKQP